MVIKGESQAIMQKTWALVLKKQNIGETDRILTIFSPTLGKKRVIARAVRKPLSKMAGHLDTFMVSQLILTDEPDLPKITSANLNESFAAVRDSLLLTNRAFAASKLIERVIIEDVGQRSIFYLTLETLTRIAAETEWTATWLYFLSQLGDRLGLGISDFTCQRCHKPINQPASWLINERAFVCQDCAPQVVLAVPLQANSIKLIQLLRRKPFEFLEHIAIPATVAKEVEEVFLREIAEWVNKPWQTYSSLILTHKGEPDTADETNSLDNNASLAGR